MNDCLYSTPPQWRRHACTATRRSGGLEAALGEVDPQGLRSRPDEVLVFQGPQLQNAGPSWWWKNCRPACGLHMVLYTPATMRGRLAATSHTQMPLPAAEKPPPTAAVEVMAAAIHMALPSWSVSRNSPAAARRRTAADSSSGHYMLHA
jgi:hypothetical protein